MRIDRLKTQNKYVNFEESFDKNDNLICVIDQEPTKNRHYHQEFLHIISLLFNIYRSNNNGQEYFIESDVTILNNQKYTIKEVYKQCKETFENSKKGFTNSLTRSIYSSKDKHFLKNTARLEDYFTLDFESDVVTFFDSSIGSPDSFLNMFCYGKYDNELVKIGEKYFNEISPIQIPNGDKLYFYLPSKKNNFTWDFRLFDKNGKEWSLIDECLDTSLLAFIISNNLIQRLQGVCDGNFNYPIFIDDVFNRVSLARKEEIDDQDEELEINEISDDYLQVIMELLKKSNRQVFIVLKEHNEKIESYCDKVVTYFKER